MIVDISHIICLLFWAALALSLSRDARITPSFKSQIGSKTAAHLVCV